MRKGSVLLNAGVGIGAEYNDHYIQERFWNKARCRMGIVAGWSGVITLGPEIGAIIFNGGHHNDYHVRTIISRL